MNIAMRKSPTVGLVPPASKITPAPWWLWKSASTKAKTTIPRISKSTPVLLTMATSRTPKMFRTVITTSVTMAKIRWLWRLFAMSQPMLLNAGMRARGSVTHTAVTVRTPAKR